MKDLIISVQEKLPSIGKYATKKEGVMLLYTSLQVNIFKYEVY